MPVETVLTETSRKSRSTFHPWIPRPSNSVCLLVLQTEKSGRIGGEWLWCQSWKWSSSLFLSFQWLNLVTWHSLEQQEAEKQDNCGCNRKEWFWRPNAFCHSVVSCPLIFSGRRAFCVFHTGSICSVCFLWCTMRAGKKVSHIDYMLWIPPTVCSVKHWGVGFANEGFLTITMVLGGLSRVHFLMFTGFRFYSGNFYHTHYIYQISLWGEFLRVTGV